MRSAITRMDHRLKTWTYKCNTVKRQPYENQSEEISQSADGLVINCAASAGELVNEPQDLADSTPFNVTLCRVNRGLSKPNDIRDETGTPVHQLFAIHGIGAEV